VSQLSELLNKIPIVPALLAWLGYTGFGVYQFLETPESPLRARQAQQDSIKKEISKLQTEIKKAYEFKEQLEVRKKEWFQLFDKLNNMKATLTEVIDQPLVTKIIREAERASRLKIESITPGQVTPKEYYAEQTHEIRFSGYFPSVLFFLDRLAMSSTILHAGDIQMSVRGANTGTERSVLISGSVRVSAFKYVASKEDDLPKTSPALKTEAPQK
jgi:Tfp pilus assembly protein PilO